MPKSIVSYIASNNPFQLNNSIVQKRESNTYRNWLNKNELIDFIDSLPVPNGVESYMYIKCHCGLEHKFSKKDDIPDKNFNCKCNRKIIEYEQK
ncbi:MAG: hypothetical protein PHF86_04130 [Candidatus Nanoarchaeia archaeon]|jgi:hypothetical protein|nr:hypothetical protein [Candidatus Nanoarchaeia archaeon]